MSTVLPQKNKKEARYERNLDKVIYLLMTNPKGCRYRDLEHAKCCMGIRKSDTRYDANIKYAIQLNSRQSPVLRRCVCGNIPDGDDVLCPDCINENKEKQATPPKITNIQFGFDDTTEWENTHLGNIEFTCEFCGIYTASKPRCNKCEAESEVARDQKILDRMYDEGVIQNA